MLNSWFRSLNRDNLLKKLKKPQSQIKKKQMSNNEVVKKNK